MKESPFTLNDIIKRANSIHNNKYDYSLIKTYKNMKDKLEIICPIHGIFTQDASSHIKKEHGCKECSYISNGLRKRKKNALTYIERANKIHNNKYDYLKTVYNNSNSIITVVCPDHGEFEILARQHLNKKEISGCRECGKIRFKEKIIYPFQSFLEEVKKLYNNKYDYSKVIWKGIDNYINVICPTHGEFIIQGIEHRKRGCYKCKKEEGLNRPTTLTTEEFILRHKRIHGENTYDYSKTKYIKGLEPITIICKKHGEYTYSTAVTMTGCHKCCMKSYSRKSIRWLTYRSIIDKCNIQHMLNDKEYKIPTTKYKADGYYQGTNTIYEFHGTIFHGDPRYTDHSKINYLGQNYGEIYNKTLKKEQTINSLGYNLITIWERDWDRIEKNILFIQRTFRKNRRKEIIIKFIED